MLVVERGGHVRVQGVSQAVEEDGEAGGEPGDAAVAAGEVVLRGAWERGGWGWERG